MTPQEQLDAARAEWEYERRNWASRCAHAAMLGFVLGVLVSAIVGGALHVSLSF